VVANGKLYSREAIDKMLAGIERLAGSN
jgi:hypothetical protein